MKIQINSKKYWLNVANKLSWTKKPKIAVSIKKNKYSWFDDGRIDIYHNMIGKNLNTKKKNNKIIYVFDKCSVIKSYSYTEIDDLVDNFLSNISILKKKRKILIHTKASLESVITMLGCLKMGIEFSVVFEELKKEAISKRINLFKPDIIFSNNYKLSTKNNDDKKIHLFKFSKIMRTNSQKKTFKSKSFKSSKKIFTLFTSGSTGMPKGIVHALGGYMVYAFYTSKKVFGMSKKSFILTASDAGWINGHTYALFGPLLCNSRTLIMEKPMMLLNKNSIINIIDLGITILYLPVTIIRMLRSINIGKINSKSLISLGSMGEPLSKDVGNWFSGNFGLPNKHIINTYYQTENGGVISSFCHNSKFKKDIHDSVGNTISKHIKLNDLKEEKKEIKIFTPWPGIMKNVVGDKKLYNNYFDTNGNYSMFDFGSKKNKNIFIHGRSDDVINIRGHRIGSEELESVVLKNTNIIECSAVSVNDEFEGSVFVLFVCIKSKNKFKLNLINKLIENNFGSFAIPRDIYVVKELPKTRSGKIMRRILRLLVNKEYKDLKKQDISTILNPNIIKEIKGIISK